ncbi:MAG TPA: leucyl aminopeptidase [Gammaproteobacteria bacterium]|nr:leucyl aminopeptidase [Gammaproteobacteria bacterium]
MDYSVKSGNPEKQRVACVVAGVFDHRRLRGAAADIDRVSGGYISAIARRGDMDGKVGQSVLLHNVPNTLCDRVLLVGCGRERQFDDKAYRRVNSQAAKVLANYGARDAVSFLTDLHVRGRDISWKVRTAVEVTEHALYRFEEFRSEKEEPPRPLRRMTFGTPSRRELPAGEQAIAVGRATAAGVKLARDLGNTPGNVCTPTYLAERAFQIGREKADLKVRVLEEKEMTELGMGALLSVSRGSSEPAKLILIEYQGGRPEDRPYALVGKGVTFDAGGISLKPAAAMDEMKFDMCGAAAVFGSISAVADLRLPINVVGVVPCSENLPDGAANKPGDIVRTMSGQTVEVLNTDAEGRLLLCDALTYSERYKPLTVIDIATLTGACIIALGHEASAVYANDSSLARALVAAGEASGDRGWEMPLWDEYKEQLKSNFADTANVGGRPAGSITAACFLSRFTGEMRWAHLDIAGTAWKSGKEKGATGRPVPMLLEYLLERAQRH